MTRHDSPYSRAFFRREEEPSARSAAELVPVLTELFDPKSVVDVGCGAGAWLSEFRVCGVLDVVGVDGPYVPRDRLKIPKECFEVRDLSRPFSLDRRFDLVLSLEVGEHLPDDRAADFIDSLTGLGPRVLFSAAIPFQGGKHHVNEQWPDYWRALFRDRGFVAVDCVRPRVWGNDAVEAYYIQTTILYAREDHLVSMGELSREVVPEDRSLNLVHPRFYLDRNDPTRLSFRPLLRSLPVVAGRALRRRLPRRWTTRLQRPTAGDGLGSGRSGR
ncbi:MAG: methyltransferase domain-containing protein [Acidimicrobiales bacterium]